MRALAVVCVVSSACGPLDEVPEAAPPEAIAPRARLELLDDGAAVLFGEDVGEPLLVPLPGRVQSVPIDARHLYLVTYDRDTGSTQCLVFSADDGALHTPASPCLEPGAYTLDLEKGPLDWVMVSSSNGCSGYLDLVRMRPDGSWQKAATAEWHGIEGVRWSKDGRSAEIDSRCPALESCPWVLDDLPLHTFRVELP